MSCKSKGERGCKDMLLDPLHTPSFLASSAAKILLAEFTLSSFLISDSP